MLNILFENIVTIIEILSRQRNIFFENIVTSIESYPSKETFCLKTFSQLLKCFLEAKL
jgi:hypothetical protein